MAKKWKRMKSYKLIDNRTGKAFMNVTPISREHLIQIAKEEAEKANIPFENVSYRLYLLRATHEGG